MGVFEHFPYVNYHELNLSWILAKLKELEDVIGSQIVDIVARAGVAENAQAIADLTETVETVETTATNAGTAASAAQATADGATTAASTAQSTANSAQTLANTLNTNFNALSNTYFVNVTSADLDTMRHHGLYHGSFTNPPAGGANSFGFVIVTPFPDERYSLQLYFSQNWSGNVGVYIRTAHDNETWYNWKTLKVTT